MIATNHESTKQLRRSIRRMADAQRRALGSELRWFIQQSRAPRLRTMREFAEQEIVIPDGPFEGRRFNTARQPYTRLLFDAIDSGRWNRIVATGPTQSGKTLSSFVVPTLYHLFEVGETVICGLPQLEMASDKWREDLLPAIDRSRYRELLPTRGAGSKGASKLTSITFGNGATLRFMGAGGGDKQRAGFTSRVLVITETDGMDEAGDASREADKITQLEARTRAYGDRKRVYMECTVSIEEGRTWTELKSGTDSQIVLPCPYCRTYVTPERKHLAGWQNADSKIAARNSAHITCPACEHAWTEDDRRRVNHQAMLLHHGQQVDTNGEISGDMPQTDTLGFRWNAVNNCFITMGDVGADEWRAMRAIDEDVADREMCQFVWATPAKPTKLDTTKLDPHEITRRTSDGLPGRGIIPRQFADRVTLAIDLGKWRAHWMLIGWHRETGAGHIIDYSILEVPSDQMDVEVALLSTIREFVETQVEVGWPIEGEPAGDDTARRVPDQVWIDTGWQPQPVYRFVRERNRGVALRHHRYRPTKGFGRSQDRTSGYRTPQGPNNKNIALVSDHYHLAKQPAEHVWLMHVNSDYWKTFAHERLAAPIHGQEAKSESPLTVFRAPPHEHLALARHLTAERETEEFEAGKSGITIRWERVRPDNHWLDCLYLACAAAHFTGIRILAAQQQEREAETEAAAHQPQSDTASPHNLRTESAARYAFTVSRDMYD